MSNPTCETCRWWVNLPGYERDDSGKKYDNYGECRRFPPPGEHCLFTVTQSDVWCGEHAPREESRE